MKTPSQRLRLLAQLENEMNHQAAVQDKVSNAERLELLFGSVKRRYAEALERSRQTCLEIELGIRLLLDGPPLAYA